jgi:DNA-binding PadR family transcriptional regulator
MDEPQVPREIKRLLSNMVLEGLIGYERNEDGEAVFKITEAGKTAVEQWMLELEDDAD